MSDQEGEQSSDWGWSASVLEDWRSQPIYSPPLSPSLLMSEPLDFSIPPIPIIFAYAPPPPIPPIPFFHPRQVEFGFQLSSISSLHIDHGDFHLPMDSFTCLSNLKRLVLRRWTTPVHAFVRLQEQTVTIQEHHANPDSAAFEKFTVFRMDYKLATVKDSSLVQISREVFHFSVDENLDSWLQRFQMYQPVRSSPQPIASPDVGQMQRQSITLSIFIKFRLHIVDAIDTLLRLYKSLADVQQLSGSTLEDVMGSLGEFLLSKLKSDLAWLATRLVGKKKNERQIRVFTETFECSRALTVKDCLFEEIRVEIIRHMELDLRPQCRSSFEELIDLPHGREMVQLDSLDQQSLVELDVTNNRAHFVKAYQNFSTVSHSEKKKTRDISMRNYGSNRVLTLEDFRQHFGSRREDVAKSFGVSVSTMKRMCRKLGIHRWPFQPERKKERLMKVIRPSMHEKHDLRLRCIEIPMHARSAPRTIALPDGGEMVHLDLLEQQSFVEFDVTNNGAHLVRASQSYSSASHSDKTSSRETLKRKCTTKSVLNFEDLQQHFGCKRDAAAKALNVSVSTVKRTCRQNGILRWPAQKKKKISETDCIPLNPQGENNVSPTCKTPTDGQADIGNEMLGCFQEQNRLLPDFIDGQNLSNADNGSKEESIKTSTFQDLVPSTYPAMNLSISSSYRESGEAGGSSELTFQSKESTPSIANPNPNAIVFAQPQISLREMLIENVGSSKDSRRFSTFDSGGFIGGHVSKSNWTMPLCSDLTPMQTMTTIPQLMPHFTESQGIRTLTFKAQYKHNTIKFHLSLKSGIVELKEEVTKRLELELGSFEVKYLDEDNDWILIACDADVWDCLKFSSSLGNEVVRLLVLDKVANSENSCKS